MVGSRSDREPSGAKRWFREVAVGQASCDIVTSRFCTPSIKHRFSPMLHFLSKTLTCDAQLSESRRPGAGGYPLNTQKSQHLEPAVRADLVVVVEPQGKLAMIDAASSRRF